MSNVLKIPVNIMINTVHLDVTATPSGTRGL